MLFISFPIPLAFALPSIRSCASSTFPRAEVCRKTYIIILFPLPLTTTPPDSPPNSKAEEIVKARTVSPFRCITMDTLPRNRTRSPGLHRRGSGCVFTRRLRRDSETVQKKNSGAAMKRVAIFCLCFFYKQAADTSDALVWCYYLVIVTFSRAFLLSTCVLTLASS